uniref:GDSL esterase/lipase n=1 Tax=Triticum urartu TaxID=4572 RepID=A0A8R7PAY4_TRIUA
MSPPHAALLLLFILAYFRGAYSSGSRSRFTSIISFGDSFADTGNLVMWADPVLPGLVLKNLPYSETFFGHPTGRATDGRLVLDFIGNQKCTTKLVQLLFAKYPAKKKTTVCNNKKTCSTTVNLAA